MSDADKLFEELGYKKETGEREITYYRPFDDGWNKIITFWVEAKLFNIYSSNRIFLYASI